MPSAHEDAPRDQCIADPGLGTVRGDAAGVFAVEWFREAVVELQATHGCGLRCEWCEGCRTQWPEPRLPSDEDAARVAGASRVAFTTGDPLRYLDLDTWLPWVREQTDAPVEVRAPACSLQDPEIVARLLRLRPDALRLELAAVDADAHRALTGGELDAEVMFAAARALRAAGIAVGWVFPCNAATVGHLHDTVLAIAAGAGGESRIALKRAPRLRGQTRREHDEWTELGPMSEQLARLPDPLPNESILVVASSAEYAPCVLSPDAARPSLFSVALKPRREDEEPAPEHCGRCAVRAYCEWSPHGATRVPTEAMSPIADDDAAALLAHGERTRRGSRGAPTYHSRAIEIPALVCYAPYTSLAVLALKGSPVPCAQSWVQTVLPARVERREAGDGFLGYWGRELRSRMRYGVPHYDAANEGWTLQEAWNAPLLRKMRREMRPRGPSSHCREMCRVLLGVEPRRGEDMLRRPPSELTPEVHENRMLLVDELNRGAEFMTANPLMLCVGVASRCNISCGFCTGPLGTHGELTDLRYDEVLRFLPTLMSLSIVGPGEPLMSKNFGRLLEHVETQGYPSLQLSITTNGTLLSPQWFRRLGRVRFSSIRVSLNSGSAAVHESITGKAVWDRMMESLDYLGARHRDPDDDVNLTLSCVLGGKVMGDLGNFAELVHRLGCHLVLEPMTGDLDGTSPFISPEKTRALAEECARVAEAYRGRNPEINSAFGAMAVYIARRGTEQRYERLPQY
ncbi:MAG: radical SAM protein [Myxococcales bacterium]|nr:radical SAM protein [Myxococcales bacterium]MCB9533967.1 radical SAM protein [Myxococcales bacterium]